jgi:hypothetical protein
MAGTESPPPSATRLARSLQLAHPDPIKWCHTSPLSSCTSSRSHLPTSSPRALRRRPPPPGPFSTVASPPHYLSTPGEPLERFPTPPSCSSYHCSKELSLAVPASSYSGELGSLPCPWSTMGRGAAGPPPRAPSSPIYPLKNNPKFSKF